VSGYEASKVQFMDEITKATLLFSLVGVLYIGLGIPLLRGRVRPNYWYGCRTQKTLSDEKIWYAVNRVTGRSLIEAGVMLIISSLVIFAFGRGMNPDYAVLILLAVLVLSVIRIAVNSFKAQKRM
jgi:uncharacterized membrane protein